MIMESLPEGPRARVCEQESGSDSQNISAPKLQMNQDRPLISVIVLNYNGANWLPLCLTSLRNQTIFDRIEIIVADNASPDSSTALAEATMEDWPNARTVRLGKNFGYSEGNNRASQFARGRYLFFLNNDSWLESDCLERLLSEIESTGAAVAAPFVMNYANDIPQRDASRYGFDIFGLLCSPAISASRQEVFVAGGCALLIDVEWFQKLGGFDSTFFMYADEHDFCWRAWQAGAKVILAASARAHHRSAAAVNPAGSGEIVEVRTSDTKRFYANRNGLVVLLKNSQHLLLALVPLQLLMLAAEATVMGLLTLRWSHVRRAYLAAVWDCWRLRKHIRAERRRLKGLRQHGDLWMLRFFRPSLNRLEEFRRLRNLGLPKVDSK
jgi:GT2 family glycosyltransferase